MLGFLVCLIALIISGVANSLRNMDTVDEYAMEFVQQFGIFLFSVLLISNMVILPIFYNTTSSFCHEMESVQATVTNTRDVDNFENATLTKKILTYNQDIEKHKYYNNKILFDWYICDCVEDIETIKLDGDE